MRTRDFFQIMLAICLVLYLGIVGFLDASLNPFVWSPGQNLIFIIGWFAWAVLVLFAMAKGKTK